MKKTVFLKSTVILAGFIVCLLCVAAPSFAEIKAGSTTMSIFGGGYAFDHDLQLDRGWTAGLGLGYNMTENWGIELVGNYIDSEFDTDAVLPGTDRDLRAYLYRLDLLYHFQPKSWFVPYVAVGAGGMTYDAQAEGAHTDNNFVADYGAGLKMFVTPAVAIRGDVRNVHSFQDDETRYSDILYTLGLTFAFGGKEEVKQEAKEEVVVPVVAPVAPLDSDKDGVMDDVDKCPETPSGVKVDKAGCPLDSDGDGVADYLDKCPNTPAGAQVDKDGCPPVTPPPAVAEKGAYVFRNIYFDTNSATIKPESEPILDEVAEFLKANPGMKMEVQGHTDNKGPAEYNMKLSEKRAAAVKAYLVKDEAVKSDRLTTKGYGITMPAASNDTAEGRVKNRRVEFKPID